MHLGPGRRVVTPRAGPPSASWAEEVRRFETNCARIEQLGKETEAAWLRASRYSRAQTISLGLSAVGLLFYLAYAPLLVLAIQQQNGLLDKLGWIDMGLGAGLVAIGCVNSLVALRRSIRDRRRDEAGLELNGPA